ncbi:MAG: heavy-metal-associated domain-containing protein [Muribaculaceae bacterium]|nr:heavy-metal-associated domain-containing protein [Muribaculaceae bacterium]
MKKTILLAALLMTMTTGFAKDIKTLVVTTTPQMHCENCESKIKGNLRFEKGVKNIETSISNQTVTIEYDADKSSAENLMEAFKKFGYEAQPVTSTKEDDDKKCDGKPDPELLH